VSTDKKEKNRAKEEESLPLSLSTVNFSSRFSRYNSEMSRPILPPLNLFTNSPLPPMKRQNLTEHHQPKSVHC
jgi:hypothetical protein